MVYDSILDNQDKAVRKFAKRWFRPYTITSANENGTYHLAEVDGTRLVVPVAGKRIKAFKKRYEDEPDPGSESDDDGRFGPDEGSESDE